MSSPKVFPFYKHLVAQQCRKDIILENDFANTRTRDRNTSFFAKYKERATKNKMRLAYLAGFSLIFSLNYFYDAFFQSALYSAIVDHSERLILRVYGRYSFSPINYKDRNAAQLGRYFQKLEYVNCRKQITPVVLSLRTPVFSECEVEAFDVDSFVSFCLKHNIAIEELPTPSPL